MCVKWHSAIAKKKGGGGNKKGFLCEYMPLRRYVVISELPNEDHEVFLGKEISLC